MLWHADKWYETKDSFPNLFVNDKKLETELSAKYLGDLFNSRGNNNRDMISDKVSVKLISIFAIVDEITFGAYQVNVLILTYNSLYKSNIIYNCRAWTNLSKEDIGKLRALQMKFLKRTLRVPPRQHQILSYTWRFTH